MSFICQRCDNPIHGDAVTDGYCTRCLMVNHSECVLCEAPVPYDEDYCDDCQDMLDDVAPDEDEDAFDHSDEEFLRGPSF